MPEDTRRLILNNDLSPVPTISKVRSTSSETQDQGGRGRRNGETVRPDTDDHAAPVVTDRGHLQDIATQHIGATLCPDGYSPLWTKQQLDGESGRQLPDWGKRAISDFRRIVDASDFPCFFAGSSERSGRLLFSFVDDLASTIGLAHAARAITEFLQTLKTHPQRVADMMVLCLLARPSPDLKSLSELAATAQSFLSALRDWDEVPWPEDLPTDPDDPRWSYAFGGEPLFINISTPANFVRRSRNVGPCMTFIISPRDVFDRVAGPNARGQQIRDSIRERTTAYDGLPFAPWSASRYGEGAIGHEQKQYLLADDNETPFELSIAPATDGSACPFKSTKS